MSLSGRSVSVQALCDLRIWTERLEGTMRNPEAGWQNDFCVVTIPGFGASSADDLCKLLTQKGIFSPSSNRVSACLALAFFFFFTGFQSSVSLLSS